jgi:hypothetical protein
LRLKGLIWMFIENRQMKTKKEAGRSVKEAIKLIR